MDPFELRLAAVLRDDAERGVIAIDAVAIADEAMRAPARRARRPWLLPAFAAVLLGASMIGGALLVGSAPDREAARPAPAELGPGTTAIALRLAAEPWGSVEVVGIQASGTERVLRTLVPADLPDGGWFSPSGSVSERGDLAVHVGRRQYALLSLADRGRALRIVSYQPVVGGRWSPDGRFATVAPSTMAENGWPIDIAEPDGTTHRIGPISLPGGGPDIVWAADGSGLLTPLESGTSPSGIPWQRYGIAQADGGAILTGVPKLSFVRGSRYVAIGGRTLTVCTEACEPFSTPSVWVNGPDPGGGGFGGGEWILDPAALPGTLVEASFASDDATVWMLFDRTDGDGRSAVLARAHEDGRLDTVASVDIDPRTTYLWLQGFAADDSRIGIGHWITGGDDLEVTILDTATGASTVTRDTVIGFVTSPLEAAP